MTEYCNPDLPTAEAVARAVVASARVLGENPLKIDGGAGLRCRYTAAEALRIIYPAASWAGLGRMLGAGALVNLNGAVNQAKRGSWWRKGGVAAVEASLEALETL